MHASSLGKVEDQTSDTKDEAEGIDYDTEPQLFPGKKTAWTNMKGYKNFQRTLGPQT